MSHRIATPNVELMSATGRKQLYAITKSDGPVSCAKRSLVI